MIERRSAGGLAEAGVAAGKWLNDLEKQNEAAFRRLEIDLPEAGRWDLPLYPRVVWKNRAGDLDIRACGIARQLDLSPGQNGSAILDELGIRPDDERGKSLRWFHWERFQPEIEPAAEWESYGLRRVLLPALELRREKDRCFLAVNRVAGSTEPMHRTLDHLTLRESVTVRMTGKFPSAGREDWNRRLALVQSAIASQQDLQKVVLARQVRYGVSEFSAEDFLDVAAGQQPGSYRFLIEPDRGTAFFGITPERLFFRSGRSIWSEALAGTRPRGDDTAADEAIGREFLASTKDRREQDLVLQCLVEALQPLTGSMSFDEEPSLRKLREVQHLSSRVHGELHPGVSDGDLLAALHPTPAVAGSPRRAAQQLIAEVEGFDRGLYAGPFGCASVQETEFAVAIRSALWQGKTLRLYAGAGILPQSSAAAEWKETEEKLSLLRGLIEDAVHEV